MRGWEKSIQEQIVMANRAIQTELLEQRIAENRASQEVDLVRWIFERVQVRESDQVLELCCGTGGQSLRMLKTLGERGRLYAVDISPEALSTLVERSALDRSKVIAVQAGLDDFSAALQSSRLERSSFDLIFCAYGLYYSSDARNTLNEALSWLKRDGRVVVIGPFGPNNWQLFDLVRASGVTIPDPVVSSSERFMSEVVVPWAAVKFQSTRISTMVNPVRWATPERVLNYWQNTTFYSADHRREFERRLAEHFARHGEFVNEKWVMMVEMTDARR
jgi:ubiquinone/menaquinone biosynthesis C-methylase UbiE